MITRTASAIDLRFLFNRAVEAAEGYDGSEAAYTGFMGAAIAFDQAGGNARKVDHLLDMAIQSLYSVNREEDFLSKLEHGGAKLFRHGAVFIPPGEGTVVAGPGEFEQPVNEPRLREVVIALQSRNIYFDDIVIDIGRVGNTQMRKWPYVIVTIPRLNAQIAVADQKGEAIFVANPSIPFMNWTLFKKGMVGQDGTAFKNITRIVHAGNWEEQMLSHVFGDNPQVGPKVHLDGYVKAQRKSKYPLTEEMVVAMAKLYRERHPERQWPMTISGEIPPDIIEAVTGDPHWQSENWHAIDTVGLNKGRGLQRSLKQTLRAHGCIYEMTEDMIVKMANLYRQKDPDRQWPTQNSGEIDHEIVAKVTGDPLWQKENWRTIPDRVKHNGRGLRMTIGHFLDLHGCNYDLTEEIVVKMARLYRERHPERLWPNGGSGDIDQDIVIQATGDPHWRRENWRGIDSNGHVGGRGLSRSLAQILKSQKENYDLTEEIVVKMARLYRERHPERLWPNGGSGDIDPSIVEEATGRTNWRRENWLLLSDSARDGLRGLTRPLVKIFEDHHCNYNLTEEMIVAWAKLYRENHPEKKWPSQNSGEIKPEHVFAVTGDPYWRKETWMGIHLAASHKARKLERSLQEIFQTHGCHYDLNEEMVVTMARLYRERHPEGKWPAASTKGYIDQDIVCRATGDKNWRSESWNNIHGCGLVGARGLTRSLSQILDAHCPERGKVHGPIRPIGHGHTQPTINYG